VANHIVFLPGTLLNSEQFAPQVAAFQNRYNVSVFEYARPIANKQGDDLLRAWADDLGEYLEGLDGPAIVCGHSLGGIVAKIASEKHAYKFDKLVLVESHFSSSFGLLGRLQLSLAKTFLRTASWNNIRTSMLRHHAKHSIESKMYLESHWHPEIPPLMFREQLIAGISYEGESLLSDIHVPTHIIVGEKFARTQLQAEIMRTKIPNSTITRVADAGHLVNLDCARAFNRAIETRSVLAAVA
jgi:pimeloyl-ACP methyl ester carboxylesterase